VSIDIRTTTSLLVCCAALLHSHRSRPSARVLRWAPAIDIAPVVLPRRAASAWPRRDRFAGGILYWMVVRIVRLDTGPFWR
jgi:hypothetical protein